MKFAGVLLAVVLIATPAASAKEIHPGDLLICGARHCRTVTDPAKARAFGALLWGQSRIASAPTPRVGSRVFALRFRDRPRPAIALISATAFRVHSEGPRFDHAYDVAERACRRLRRAGWAQANFGP